MQGIDHLQEKRESTLLHLDININIVISSNINILEFIIRQKRNELAALMTLGTGGGGLGITSTHHSLSLSTRKLNGIFLICLL